MALVKEKNQNNLYFIIGKSLSKSWRKSCLVLRKKMSLKKALVDRSRNVFIELVSRDCINT